jgi:hypothetical protein
MAEPEINAFLTHLAVREKVSASTQNQALSALLFLYRHVIGREVGDLGEVIRARKPTRLPHGVKHWSLTTLREKLIKIGAKAVQHARYVVLQKAEVAIPRGLFGAILERIRRLRLSEAVPR